MMRFGAVLSILLTSAAPLWAQASDDAPLSAIDWLSESVEQPRVSLIRPPHRRFLCKLWGVLPLVHWGCFRRR
jgi:hypothetical protein